MSLECAKTIAIAAIVFLYVAIDRGTARADDIEGAPNSTAGRAVERTILPKDIWAFDMPGTRQLDIRRREGEYIAAEGPLVWELLSSDSLKTIDSDGQQRQCYAVQGEGMVALEQVGRIMIMDEEPEKELNVDDPITLVFFTAPLSAGIEIDCVRVHDSTIDIQYHFVSRLERGSSPHIALIPLGRLASGSWKVLVTQGKVHKTPTFRTTDLTRELSKWQKTVCLPFEFGVRDDARVD